MSRQRPKQDERVGLRQARERTGLSREKVAPQVGISSKTLERWERGDTSPKRYIVERLAVIYGITVDAIELEVAA